MSYTTLFELCRIPAELAGNKGVRRPMQLAGLHLTEDTRKWVQKTITRKRALLAFVLDRYVRHEGISNPLDEVIKNTFMPLAERIDAGEDWEKIRPKLIEAFEGVHGKEPEDEVAADEMLDDIWNYLEDDSQLHQVRRYKGLARWLSEGTENDNLIRTASIDDPFIQEMLEALSRRWELHWNVQRRLSDLIPRGIFGIVEESLVEHLKETEDNLPDDRPLMRWDVCWRIEPVTREYKKRTARWKTKIPDIYDPAGPFKQWAGRRKTPRDNRLLRAHLEIINDFLVLEIPQRFSYQDNK